MSTEPPVEAPVTMPEAAEAFAPQPGIGVPLAVGTFGFSVLVLGLPTSRIISPDALGIFVPVAFGTGALGLFIGGLWEYRANNIFGGSFALFYACFLFTTALILRFFAPGITEAAGEGGFGDAFGAWLILWAIFTSILSVGAWHINMPAFLAFALLALAYVLLGIANLASPGGLSDAFTRIGGWVLLADGATAWYLTSGLVLNPTVGRELVPLWPWPYTTRKA
jgi:uncharacterized protein